MAYSQLAILCFVSAGPDNEPTQRHPIELDSTWAIPAHVDYCRGRDDHR